MGRGDTGAGPAPRPTRSTFYERMSFVDRLTIASILLPVAAGEDSKRYLILSARAAKVWRSLSLLLFLLILFYDVHGSWVSHSEACRIKTVLFGCTIALVASAALVSSSTRR